MSVHIQLADGHPGDLDAVMTVMLDSFDPAFGEAWTAPQCAGLLHMPGVWLTLALDGEEACGFALGRIVADEAELLLLAVRRGTRRKGVGAMLVSTFSSKAAEMGAATLHLEVRDGNPAVKLYDSFGFLEVGRRRNYYTGCNGEAFDAITLLKRVRN